MHCLYLVPRNNRYRFNFPELYFPNFSFNFLPHLLIHHILDLAKEGVAEFGAGTGAVTATMGAAEGLGEDCGHVFYIRAGEFVEALGADEFCSSAYHCLCICNYSFWCSVYRLKYKKT